MKVKYTISLAKVAVFVLCVVVAQSVRAQTKPPAFYIIEITVSDPDGYTKKFLPAIANALEDLDARFIVRGGQTVSLEGAAPSPRVVILQLESMDKLKALYESPAYKHALAIAHKYSTINAYGVEGFNAYAVEGVTQ